MNGPIGYTYNASIYCPDCTASRWDTAKTGMDAETVLTAHRSYLPLSAVTAIGCLTSLPAQTLK